MPPPRSPHADPPQTPPPPPLFHQVAIGSLNNVFYVFNIAFFASVLAACAAWLAWRAARLRAAPAPFMHDDDKSVASCRNRSNTPRWRQSETAEHVSTDISAEDALQFRPLRAHWAGRACYALCCAVSLQIIALYLVFLVDFYQGCQLRSIDNLCFYGTHFLLGSYMANGTAFFVVWCVSVFWFTGWVLCKGRVINWFRLPCPTADATHVVAWSPDAVEVVSLYASPVVAAVRKLRNAVTPAWARGSFKTLPVVTGAAGRRYFVFEGVRFVLGGGGTSAKNSIVRARYTVATTAADLHRAVAGLSTADADERRELVGANACPFRPASFRELLVDEFFTLFHVYQLVQYVLMFWFSYLFVAAIMSMAVLMSAGVSMLLVSRAQRAVERVANHTSRVRVRRDGAWTDADSGDLVPGDVVRLGPGDRVPCDVVLVGGTCVVDESSLTGESLPCIKTALADEASFLDVRHPPPRHTLFDGTVVRQAGTGGEEGVTAVVIATGMDTTKGDLLSVILFPARMVFKYDEELAVVILLLLAYSALCFGLAIDFQGRAGTQSDWVTKWIYATAIVSQVLSPLLPVALEVGQIQVSGGVGGGGKGKGPNIDATRTNPAHPPPPFFPLFSGHGAPQKTRHQLPAAQAHHDLGQDARPVLRQDGHAHQGRARLYRVSTGKRVGRESPFFRWRHAAATPPTALGVVCRHAPGEGTWPQSARAAHSAVSNSPPIFSPGDPRRHGRHRPPRHPGPGHRGGAGHVPLCREVRRRHRGERGRVQDVQSDGVALCVGRRRDAHRARVDRRQLPRRPAAQRVLSHAHDAERGGQGAGGGARNFCQGEREEGGATPVLAPPPARRNAPIFSSRPQLPPPPPHHSHAPPLSTGLVRNHRRAVQGVDPAGRLCQRCAAACPGRVLRAGSGQAFAERQGGWDTACAAVRAAQCAGQRTRAQHGADMLGKQDPTPHPPFPTSGRRGDRPPAARRSGARPDVCGAHYLPQRAAGRLARDDCEVEGERASAH